MRVLFLNYEFPPLGGGGAKSSEKLVEALAERPGLDIDLATVTTEAARAGEENFSESVTRYNVYIDKKDLHYWTNWEIFQFIWKFYFKLNSLLKEQNYDVYHSFFGFPTGLIPALLGCRPHVISFEGSDVPGFSQRVESMMWILGPIYRYIWHRADALIANSSDLRDLALEFDDTNPVEVIPNGIDCERFRPGPKDSDPNKLNILTASRLVPRKNVSTVIRSLPDIQDRIPNRNVRLLVAGDGPELEHLRQLADEEGVADDVNWLGRVPIDEMPAIYQQADLFVLASDWEGNSNALLEALASRLPVVVTDTGGARDLVDDNGIIVDAPEPPLVADAIVEVAKDESKRQLMAERSRERAEKLSWETMAERYEAVYREAIAD